jgi:hypothetical protein
MHRRPGGEPISSIRGAGIDQKRENRERQDLNPGKLIDDRVTPKRVGQQHTRVFRVKFPSQLRTSRAPIFKRSTTLAIACQN